MTESLALAFALISGVALVFGVPLSIALTDKKDET